MQAACTTPAGVESTPGTNHEPRGRTSDAMTVA